MKICLQTNCFNQEADILRNEITKRISNVSFTKKDTSDVDMKITLQVEPTLGKAESYEITINDNDLKRTIETMEMWTPTYTITGADSLGLLFGIGKFLHTAIWEKDAFYHLTGNDGLERTLLPKLPQGVVSPDCPVRAIYFALHNYNWYQEASEEELLTYLTELLLYGYNTVMLILPVMNIREKDDEIAVKAVSAIRKMFLLAKSLSMKCGLFINVNQGFVTAPHEWDADPSYDNPDKVVRGSLGRNLCPNKEGTLAYLRSIWNWEMDSVKDIGLNYVVTWPYDEGGCGCEKCRPWGAKGYLDLAKLCFQDMKERFPKCEMIISTWLFDRVGEPSEYEGLYKRLRSDCSEMSYIMVDDHNDFPQYPLTHESVKPVINFPEISMWRLWPWGGYGANPLPKRFEGFFRSAKDILFGGAPYSEGIYEDISKVQCVGYYWNKNASYQDIFREYMNYEFGVVNDEGEMFPEILSDAIHLTELIEHNHTLVGMDELPVEEECKRIGELARSIDGKLSEKRRASWRWHILYTRAILDEKRYAYFFSKGDFSVETLRNIRHLAGVYLKKDPEAQDLFQSLREIYHCVPLNEENYYTLPPFDGEVVVNGKLFIG